MTHGLLALLVWLFWTSVSFTLPAAAAEQPQITAASAILIDQGSGTVLVQKAPDILLPPSSMSKLVTLAVVFHEIRHGRLKLDSELPISVYAWRHGGAPSGSSTMFAPVNSKVPVQDLIKAVIIQSANDGAIALAEGIAGSESAFARLMTERARALGLSTSTFVNPTGLPDAGQRMSVRELAMLADHLMRQYPEYYPLFSEKDFTWNKIRQSNRNSLLAMGIGADGMKTGFTKEGGYGIVASAIQKDQRLILVLNGAKTDKDRFEEARKLLEWGFSSFETHRLFDPGETIAEASVFAGSSSSVELVAGATPVLLLLPRGPGERLSGRVIYQGPLRAPVQADQQVAVFQVKSGDRLVLQVPLFTKRAVAIGSLHQRAMDAIWELGTMAVRRVFKKS